MVSDENNLKRSHSLSEVKIEDQEPNPKKAKVNKKYGVTKYSLDDCPDLVNVVKQILGVDISSKEKAKDLIIKVFRILNKNKTGGTNFLLWNGTIYLNGLIPISDFNGSLQIKEVREEPYPVLQLCEILGYKDKKTKRKLEAAGRIADCFPLLNESLDWNPVNAFFDEAKVKKNLQIDSLLDKYLQENAERIEAVAEYIKALRSLGISTVKLKFNRNELLKSFNEAENKTKDLMKGFLEEFGKYIKELDENDGINFLERLKNSKSYLKDIQELYYGSKEDDLLYYKKYTHTERMVQYLRNQKEPFYAVSYNDPCTNLNPSINRCEQMLAEITPEDDTKPNTIVISGCPYYGSRGDKINQRRENPDLVNHSLWLFQLSPEPYQIN